MFLELNELANSLHIIVEGIQVNYKFVFVIIGILWGVFFVNKLLKGYLCVFGIYPRSLFGLIGILFAPFLHYDFDHILFNSFPLFLLANFVLLSGHQAFYVVTITIMGIGGGLTWLFGRKALHIGASYVITGYFGYLLCLAYRTHTVLAVGLAVIALYYFGGILLSIFPKGDKVSWESHLFGIIAGIAACFLLV